MTKIQDQESRSEVISLRSYLTKIRPHKISKEVSTRLDVANYLSAYKEPLLFERVKGYPSYRIVGNIINSRDTVAKVLGVHTSSIIAQLDKAMQKPMRYSLTRKAPFFDNEIEDPELLRDLPLLMFFPNGNKYYASATIIVARDPETGRQNLSFHRLMYVNGKKFAARLVPPRDLYRFYTENKEQGKDTPIAIICGVHPIVALAASTSCEGVNELEIASALTNGRLRCVKVDGFDVPSESEVVLVGRILKDEVVDEGPFVDVTSTWDEIRKEPVIEVDKIYHRDQPIWQAILPGGKEHRLLMGIPQEPKMYRIIKNTVPTVKNIVLTEGGCNWLHAVVSIQKRVEGDGKNAGLAALAAHPSLKMVIVVDEDIDIMDYESIEWALATRLQPSEDVTIISNVRGSSLDPSSRKKGITSKLILDATIPLDRNRSEFTKVGFKEE